jgi:selenocysteine lyase/cysteine desulfurase
MKSFQRRTFLSQMVAAGAAPLIPTYLLPDLDMSWISGYKKSTSASSSLTFDEQFWYQIKTMYSVSPGLLNLNNGGVSPQPIIVQEARERYDKMSNEAPSYYMWRILDQGREPLRQRLADMAGVSNEEVSICRNASEALETIIFGLRLQKGDAVVLSKLDYPNMMNAWKQRELRDGIVLKWVELDLPKMTDNEIVNAFEEQMTPDVKVVHVTHMINWNGHILPVRKIADKAHEHAAQVLVDGAHTFAHIQFTIPDLGADYFGTSLHKWLCAPFGSGMLYVKKEHIAALYPLLAHSEPESGDIRKFESLGTRSFPIEQAIGQAIDFQNSIGGQLKQERLQFLKQYWTEAVKDNDRIKIKSDTHPSRSCALCLVEIDGMTVSELTEGLLTKYKIHTTGIDYANVQGVRVTPHVYTVKSDLDRLISALHSMASS